MRKKFLLISMMFMLINPQNSLASRDAAYINAIIEKQAYPFAQDSILYEFNELEEIDFSSTESLDLYYLNKIRPLGLLSPEDIYYAPSSKIKKTYKKFVPNVYDLSIASSQSKQNPQANKTDSNLSLIQLSKALNLISNKKHFEAEIYLDDLNTKPTSVYTKTNIATLYEKIKRYPKAIKIYETILQKEENRLELVYRYGNALYKAGQYSKALTQLEYLTTQKKDYTLAHYTKGNVYFAIGNYKQALQSFAKAAEQNPYCADAFYNIGIILEGLGKTKLALKYYMKCINIAPDDLEALKAINRLQERLN